MSFALSPEFKAWLSAIPLLLYISLDSGNFPSIHDLSVAIGTGEMEIYDLRKE